MTSACKHCGAYNSFEIVEQSPKNSKNKLFFVQCSVCGQPIGVLEYFVGWEKMNNIEEKVKRLQSTVDNVEYLLRTLINNSRR